MGITSTTTVRRGHSSAEGAAESARELAAAIRQEHGFHFVFASPRYPAEPLANALVRELGPRTVGCTTAGEITPRGYASGTLTGFSLPGEADVSCHLIDDLREGRHTARIAEIATDARERISRAQTGDPRQRAFGILLVDGLCGIEELVAAELHAALGGLPLVGGSAGDALGFREAYVFHGGRCHSGAAVFCLVLTTRPFHLFKAQHFQPTEEKLVVTRAVPEERRVLEINGRPAATEYSRVTGVDFGELHARAFSRHPVMLRIGGESYVRSIQKANPDDSLTFFCAIDEGLVLTVADGLRFVESLQGMLADVQRRLPDPELLLGFECVLRRLEVESKGLVDTVSEALAQHRVVGFHTYGEQYGGLHVNQTWTGLALGREP